MAQNKHPTPKKKEEEDTEERLGQSKRKKTQHDKQNPVAPRLASVLREASLGLWQACGATSVNGAVVPSLSPCITFPKSEDRLNPSSCQVFVTAKKSNQCTNLVEGVIPLLYTWSCGH